MFRIDFAGETEDLIMETTCNLVVNTTFQSTNQPDDDTVQVEPRL